MRQSHRSSRDCRRERKAQSERKGSKSPDRSNNSPAAFHPRLGSQTAPIPNVPGRSSRKTYVERIKEGRGKFSRRDGRKRRRRAATTTDPEATSQTLIDRSRLAETMKSPAGRNRALETEWSCPYRVLTFLYSFVVSQSLMVRSEEQVTRRAVRR
jgi:hypothetical protein